MVVRFTPERAARDAAADAVGSKRALIKQVGLFRRDGVPVRFEAEPAECPVGAERGGHFMTD